MLHRSSPDGFALLETLIAATLLIGLATGVAHVVSMTRAAVGAGGADSTSTLLAVQKLEELRSLTWAFDPRTGRPRSDVTTDLATDPPTAQGRGLRDAPATAAALDTNVAGYVDFLDTGGAWLGTGREPPPGTAYVRRWSVGALASPAGDVLALQVLVIAVGAAPVAPRRPLRPSDPGVAWIATLRARR